jgi:hypothetical protein
METSHYALIPNAPQVPLRLSSAKNLLNVINKNFGTLPWCRRYLDRLGQDKYLLGVRGPNDPCLGCWLMLTPLTVEQSGSVWNCPGLPASVRYQGFIHSSI